MPPALRVVIATVLVVLAAGYGQLTGMKTSREQYKAGSGTSALIREVSADPTLRTLLQRHPDEPLGLVVVGDDSEANRGSALDALRYAFLPHPVRRGDAAITLVLFKVPGEADRYEVEHRLPAGHRIGQHIRVYQRERN